jgi:hypothetical protein
MTELFGFSDFNAAKQSTRLMMDCASWEVLKAFSQFCSPNNF